jgi:hypothetical protein
LRSSETCVRLRKDLCYYISIGDYKTARALLDIALFLNCKLDLDECDSEWLEKSISN